MSRIPPALLYLTIYNPSLRPAGPVSPDDEDAEEQAHILFYTARERAVSRDRMLRQVGLAKALVNFASMFNADEVCENIHSQSRRMVILCPEPGFWVHACVEVAKTPRRPPEKVKAKGKEKGQTKGKGKEQPEVVWDYHDGSVSDAALHAHIQAGYEQFKLTHGSMSSILDTLGQQALELQLERFFTVWAWKWDLEDGFEFGSTLGVPLHPHYRSLLPAFDDMQPHLLGEEIPFVLASPSLIPSQALLDTHLPSSLARYFLGIFPAPPSHSPRRASSRRSSRSDKTAKTWSGAPDGTQGLEASDDTLRATSAQAGGTAKQFLDLPAAVIGMPAVAVNATMNAMDVRKWNWGALTFGKGKKVPGPSVAQVQPAVESAGAPAAPEAPKEGEPDEETKEAVPVDAAALQQALSTNAFDGPPQEQQLSSPPDASETSAPGSSSSSPPAAGSPPLDGLSDRGGPATGETAVNAASPSESGAETDGASDADAADSASASISKASSRAPSTLSLAFEPPSAEASEPAPTFLSTSVFLADGNDPLSVKRRRVCFLHTDRLTFLLLCRDMDELEDTRQSALAEKASSLLRDVRKRIDDAEQAAAGDDTTPIARILDPKDLHIVLNADGTTISSTGFSSKSEHLFNGKQLLNSDPAVLEVFSRGQNPQHWHISRRGVYGADGAEISGTEAYLEVKRKETSLTDVDTSWRRL